MPPTLQPVPYGSLVARNIRALRAAANLSQTDVAERMVDLGFSAWLRSTVSLAEQGKRRLTAEEMLGLMVAFETDLTAITYPAAEFHPVVLPGGQEVVLPSAKYSYNPDRQSVWAGNKCLLKRFGEDGSRDGSS